MGHQSKQSNWWEHRVPSYLSCLALLALAGVWAQSLLAPLLDTSDRWFGSFGLSAAVGLSCLSLWFICECYYKRNSGNGHDNDQLPIHPKTIQRIALALLMVGGIAGSSALAAHRAKVVGIPLSQQATKGDLITVRGQVAGCFTEERPPTGDKPSTDDLWNAIPRGDKQTISLRNCSAYWNGIDIEIPGKMILYLEDRKIHPINELPDLANVEIGDQIKVSGKFSWPAEVHNPGQFDVRQWLYESGISGQVNVSSAIDIEVIDRSFRWTSLGDRLKNHFRNVVMNSISPEQQDMAAAILLGDRSLLDQEQKQRYAATGTIHILAISGLHVGILAGTFFLFGCTVGVPRRVVFLSLIVLVVFYAWLVEYRAPIVRAAVLTTVFCIAGLVRRRIFSLNSLAAAVLVVFCLQPAQLLNPGTHLSFLAVGSIVLLHCYRSDVKIDPLEAIRLSKLSSTQQRLRGFLNGCYEAYRYSAAVFFICLPMVIHHFHVAAWIGLLINPIVILPMASALICGFVMLLTSNWLTPVSGWFGWGCSLSLSSIDSIVGWAHQLPHSHQYLASPGGLWVTLWYALIFTCMWYFGSALRLRWLVLGFGVLLIAFRWFAIPAYPDRWDGRPQLTATFVDVGHGNCTVIRTPDDTVIVCDAGSFPNANSAIQKISNLLWAHGIERIDQLLISHADLDHYNAVPALLDRFRVGEIVYPKKMFPAEGDSIEALEKVIRQSGVAIREVVAGELLFDQADCKIKVLSPPADQNWTDDNAKSLVVRVSYGQQSILLTGDLEQEGIDYLLLTQTTGPKILQVPHHGSRNNDPQRISQWAAAEYSIVSALDKRVQPDVVEIYQSSGAKVLIPNREGATLFNLFPDQTLIMRQWDNDRWWIR